MKINRSLLMAGLGVALLTGFIWGNKDDKGEKTSGVEEVQVKEPKSYQIGDAITVGDQSGTVIYNFEGADQMRQFAGMWQQRQGIQTRVAVLQAYLREEGARRDELDKLFANSYGIDINQRFLLDSDNGMLIQLEPLPEELPEAAAGTAQSD